MAGRRQKIGALGAPFAHCAILALGLGGRVGVGSLAAFFIGSEGWFGCGGAAFCTFLGCLPLAPSWEEGGWRGECGLRGHFCWEGDGVAIVVCVSPPGWEGDRGKDWGAMGGTGAQWEEWDGLGRLGM